MSRAGDHVFARPRVQCGNCGAFNHTPVGATCRLCGAGLRPTTFEHDARGLLQLLVSAGMNAAMAREQVPIVEAFLRARYGKGEGR